MNQKRIARLPTPLLLSLLLVSLAPATTSAQSLVDNDSQARSIGNTDIWIAALGDSFASGEGNPTVLGAPVRNWRWMDDEQCHRSKHAWTYQVAERMVGLVAPLRVKLSFLACTGAEGDVGILRSYRSAPWPAKKVTRAPQMDRLEDQIKAAGRVPDVVLLSAGGNDLGFADLVVECLGLFPNPKKCPGGEASANLPERIRALIATDGTYANIAARLDALGIPSNRVLLLVYPNPVEGRRRVLGRWGDLGVRSSCITPLIPGGKSAWTWVNEQVVAPLRKIQRDAAKTYGWTQIDGHLSSFEQHSYCPRNAIGADSWWVGSSALVRQGSVLGMFHPNRRGHDEITEAAVAKVRMVTEVSLRDVGAVCHADADCRSGSCDRDDRCQCKVSKDCGSGRYCDTGTLGAGKNACRAAKKIGDRCSADKQCGAGLECSGVVGLKKCKRKK